MSKKEFSLGPELPFPCNEHGNYQGALVCYVCFQEHVLAAVIKLLDQNHNPTEGDKVHNASGNCTACEVIARIKGEQK